MKGLIKHINFTCFILTGISCCFTDELVGQDLHFSQFYEAPLLRNPALAGLFEGDIRVQGVHRSQWNSISYPFQTSSINAEYKFHLGSGEDFMTFGGQVMYDKAGTVQLRTVQMLPALTFHKSLSQNRNTYLSVGFMGGMVSRGLDRSRVTTNSQYDGFYFNGALPDGETFIGTYSYMDMSVGMSFNSTLGANEQHNFFAGVAYHHFNKPVSSFYKNVTHLPKYVFSGGLKLNLDEYSYLTFHGDLLIQTPFKQAIAGGMYSKRIGDESESYYTVHAGMFYRYNDALIPVLKFDVQKLSVGISYDINTSSLATASRNRGGFEISLSYITARPRRAQTIHCPTF
ncbi:MAG: PorP/SprF family type IX secretion system membrane protein [bacterium]